MMETLVGKLTLRKLQREDFPSFVAAYKEFQESRDFEFVSFFQKNMGADELFRILDEREKGINLPSGQVCATYLFGVVERKIVGRVMIRHNLNDFLLNIGGHVGYGVVPSERKKGYATEMLRQAIEFCRQLGFKRILLTCDEDNLASRKTIERCGGVRRYWINLK